MNGVTPRGRRCGSRNFVLLPHRPILAAVKVLPLFLVVTCGSLAAGCGGVTRQLSVDSQPQGALVYLNNQEAGRTPFTTDIDWYGTYDVVVRKEGFQTLTTKRRVIAPWWLWPPFDLIAELAPGRPTDRQTMAFTLEAQPTTAPVDDIIRRGQELRRDLPATRAAE